MPTETFLKLPEEKKNRILEAAIKEYARVSPDEVSIKNIVEDAGIARGSFYQYFESKYDLLNFILKKDFELMEEFIFQNLEKNNGNIFKLYIDLFDYIVQELFLEETMEFHRKVFENIKTSDDMFSFISNIKIDEERDEEVKPIFEKKEILEKINIASLKVKDEDELKILLNMLIFTLKKAIVSCFKYSSFEKSREEYVKMLEFIKNGALK